MKQLGVLLLAAALGLLAVGPSAFAQKPPTKKSPPAATAPNDKPAAPAAKAPPPSEPAHPAIEQAALDILKATSDRLSRAKTISFVARGAFDVPARNGQPLFYLTRSEVLLVRPNKLRVIVPGDGPPSEFYYDGKEIAVFTPNSDLVATTEAPGNLDQALKTIYEKAGIYFPFVDFIVADPYKALTEGLTSAFVIGQSKLVGDVTTNIVSISDPHVHLQIWIGSEDKLPRLIWATAAEGADRPRHSVEFTDWRLDGVPVTDAFFAPHTTASTKHIPFGRPDADEGPKEQAPKP